MDVDTDKEEKKKGAPEEIEVEMATAEEIHLNFA